MRRTLQLAAWFALASFCAAQTLDRIVIVVDKGIILASEWEQSVRYEAMLEGADLRAVTDAQRERTLDRLIDQALLQQQIAITTYQPASADEISAQVHDVRKQLKLDADDARWLATLERYRLNEEDVRERVAVQLDILRFVDLRFRPSIRIDRRTIDAYYKNTFVPQVQATGTQPASLAQASPAIEELLIQQRIDELLNAYLKNLRTQARIRRLDEHPIAKEAPAR